MSRSFGEVYFVALKRVGFFREVRALLQEDTRGLPSLHDAVREEAQPNEDLIFEYLREGCCLAAAGGFFPDVLNPRSTVGLTPDYLTDGVWLWPGELWFYVKHYHAAQPADFVGDMRENGWVVPALSQALCNALCREIFPNSESGKSEPEA